MTSFILALVILSGCAPIQYYGYEKVIGNGIESAPEGSDSSPSPKAEGTHERAYPGLFCGDYKTLIFKARAQIRGHSLGGLLIIKLMEEDLYRIVFMKEFGMTILALEIDRKSVKVHHALKQLNRKRLIASLGKTMRLLLEKPFAKPLEILINDRNEYLYKYSYGKMYNYYFYGKRNSHLSSIENASKRHKNARIEFGHYKTLYGNAMPTRIKILDFNIKLEIDLTLLQIDEHPVEQPI